MSSITTTGLSDAQRTLITAISTSIMAVNVYILTLPGDHQKLAILLGIAATVAVIFRDIYGVKEAAVAAVSKKVDPTVEVKKEKPAPDKGGSASSPAG